MANVLVTSPLDNFGPEECSLARKLCQRTGGHMLTTKIGTTVGTGQTFSLNRSDQFGQLVQNVKWTSPLDSSRQVDQDSYIERPIWSPDEGDMTSGRYAPRADRSDRFARADRPVSVCRIRVKVVFWHEIC